MTRALLATNCQFVILPKMSTPHQKTAFVFRRDLRLADNLGLIKALEESAEVIPVFIFDPAQVSTPRHEYFSEAAFAFLLHSLQELDAALQTKDSRLYVLYGDQADVVESLITTDGVDAVYVNKDYTPFARKRDKAIVDVCTQHSCYFERCDDLTLSPIETIRTGQGKLYTVFTPFKNNAAKQTVPQPRKNNLKNYFCGALTTSTTSLSDFQADINDRTLILHGGRTEALTILNAPDFFNQYNDRRNHTADETGTSRLSAHHKFGTISIRESFHAAKNHPHDQTSFISELYWRDFYLYIAYHFPVVFGQSFLPWAEHMEWVNDQDQFAAWCAGKTGVPMVDAGMRQLNQTGYMHNRSRMIVASYLTKNLLIDWRWGERYFATQLIDYDPAANNGGWQWSASVGADPKPIRIFNPYTQATKYDPEAVYIKKWVTELGNVPDTLLTDGKTQDLGLLAPDYPAPLVNQKESYHRAMAAYKQAKEVYRPKQNN